MLDDNDQHSSATLRAIAILETIANADGPLVVDHGGDGLPKRP
jgi:hypothetical protein